ncbi:MAG: hypothetical protein D8M59_03855 [Planctomycetes bacterium]|nr:hypothetical protein [Planctomycetota bacterium]NOG53130.1 hypothetical protein [Planctomycetota bacterium]
MRITRMDIESTCGTRFAVIERKRGSDRITVTLLTPATPNGREHTFPARGHEDQRFSMAELVQTTIDGHRGTNSMIHDYLRELERFAD